MSVEDNKTLVRRYLAEVWERKNVAAFDQFLAPGYRRHVSPLAPPLDPAGQKERLAGIRAAFPDVELKVVDLFAEGDRVAFRSVMRGTHLGSFRGLAPTGRSITVALLDVVRIEHGRIVEQWGGPDFLDLLVQLGATVEAGSERRHE